MSAEPVRKILGSLQEDPENEAAWTQLEQSAIEGRLAELGPEARTLLEQARQRYQTRGDSEAAARILDIEAMIANGDATSRVAIVRERARLLEEELLDDKSALAALESIKDLDPDAAQAAVRIAGKKQKWKDIVADITRHAHETPDPEQIARHLTHAASIVLQYKGKGRDKDVDNLFSEALSVDPGNLRAIQLYERVLRRRGNKWDEVVAHLDKGAEAVGDPSARAALLLRAARVHATRRNDPGAAEQAYRKVLAVDPGNYDANRYLAVMLQGDEKRVDDLVKLYEDQLRVPGQESDLGLLIQVAMTHWRMRNDPSSAAPFLARVATIQPDHPLPRNFFADNPSLASASSQGDADVEISVDEEDHAGDVQSIEPPRSIRPPPPPPPPPPATVEPGIAASSEPARPASTPPPARSTGTTPSVFPPAAPAGRPATGARNSVAGGNRVTIAIDLAQHAEESGQTDRAIESWKGVLRLDAANRQARDALTRLYTATARWNNLVELLRQELESLGGAKAGPEGQANKERKLEILREMVGIYRDRMNAAPMVVQTYNAILALEPGDADALVQLAENYEKLGRWSDVVKVLEQQAEGTTDNAARIEMLKRQARIWIDRFNNVNNATRPLEQILALDPSNTDALTELKDLYNKRRAWRPLFEVLRKEAATLTGTPRRDALVEIARLAAEKLNSPADAIAVWREALALDPRTPGALDALEKLTERERDYPGLAEVLEQRANETGDAEARVNVLMKLGTVYGERLNDPVRSIETWRRVLEAKPGHPKALRVLRESYTNAGDWDALEQLYADARDYEGLVEVLGNAADRAEDPATRVALSFRTAGIYETRLEQPARAFRSYERVLTVESTNLRAATALVPIYLADEKWGRLSQLYEILLGALPGDDVDGSLDYLEKLRELAATRLNDRAAAFRWALRAYKLRPSDPKLEASLERAAAESGAWRELVQTFDERAQATGDDAEKARLRDKSAAIEADRLNALDDAIGRYQHALTATPRDHHVIDTLDRLLRRGEKWRELRDLFDVRLLGADDAVQRRALLLEVAGIEESRLADAEAASRRYRSILDDDAHDADALMALSRLAETGGRWKELETLVAQRRDEASGSMRAELAFKLGQLRLERLGDVEGAIESFREVLSLVAHHPAALAALETLLRDERHRVVAATLLEPEFAAIGEARKLAWVLQILLDSSTAAETRKALTLRLARVYGEQLNDPRSGFELVRGVLAEQPDQPELAIELEGLAANGGWNEELAEAFARIVARTDIAPPVRVELARRAAVVYDDRLRRPDAAEPFHRIVVDAGDLDTHAFSQLKALYQGGERWAELRALYATWVSRAPGADAQIELLGEEALIVEEILDQPDEAIEVYRRIHALDPSSRVALRALDRLLTRQSRWNDVATLLTEWIGIAPEEARELRFRRGEVFERRLEQYEKAFEDYESVVGDDLTHADARAGLERLVEGRPELRRRAAAVLEVLYEGDGAASARDLVRMLLVRLEGTEDREKRAELYRRVAELRERQLGDTPGAFDAITQSVLAAPNDEGLRSELLRLAESAHRNAEAADALERAASEPEAIASRVPILQAVALLFDERLGDLPKAERTYRRLLDAAPDEAEVALASAVALERIYSGLDNARGLVEALSLRAKFENDADMRRELYARAGELQEFELKEPLAAIDSHRARLEIEPGDRLALASLARLYETTGRWSDLVATLRKDAELATDGDEQKRLLLRAARTLEERVADIDAAIVLYAEVLETFGPDREVHRALARLYELSDRWTDLLDVLERDLLSAEASADRLALIVRIAELRRVRTGDLPKAVEGYEEALQIDPSQPEARAALDALLGERETGVALAAARALAPVLEADNTWERLVTVLDRIATETDDAEERRRVLARAASVCEMGLQNPGRAFGYAAREFKESLGEPDLRPRMDHLEHLATAASLHADYARVLREVAPDLVDPDLQIEAYMTVATLSRGPLGDRDTARAYYEKALEQRPDYAPALDALESLHEASGANAELLETLRRKTELATSDRDRRELLRKQARISEEALADRQGAARSYEQILELGDDREAAAALERIYAAEGRWDDLTALLESQLSNASADPVDLHHRLGVVAFQHLDNPDRAIEHFKEVLERRRDHGPTVTALEELGRRDGYAAQTAEILEPIYRSQLDWPKVIAALEARIAAEGDPTERKALLTRLATLFEENVGDLDKALDTYARVFREDISDRETWETIAKLAKVQGRYDRQAEIQAQALAETSSEDDTTSELAFRTGQLYDRHVGDAQKARVFYRRALAFDPNRTEVFGALESLLARDRSHGELLALYGEAAQNAADPEAQKGFYFKIAEIQEQAQEDAGAAIETYRRVLEVDPTDAKATAALDRLLSRESRWRELAELLEKRIDDAMDSSERAQLRFRLGQLRADRLDDAEGAVEAFEAIVQEKHDHRDAINALEQIAHSQPALRGRIVEILEPLYRELDDWPKLIVVLNARLDASEDAIERGGILREIAQLKEERARDISGAFGAYGSAFAADPGDGEARSQVERLASEHALWDELVRTYEAAFTAAQDTIIKSDLLKAIAETHDQRRDDPRAAIEAYERLYALDDSQIEALDLLQGLHVLLSDWDGLVRVLERKVERSLDDDQRKSLLHEIGEYQRDMLGNSDAAIDAFKRALEMDPGNGTALEALDDLYSARNDHRALAEVLRMRLEIETEADARKPLALRLGRLEEKDLNDPPAAIEAYRRALEDAPTETEALLALDRLFQATGAHADLLENLRTQVALAQDEHARNAMRLRIGRLLASELTDPAGALEIYREVLSTDPSNTEAIAAVRSLADREDERADAVAVLEPIFRQGNRWDDLVAILELKIRALEDPFARRDELRSLAEVHESGRRDASSAFDSFRRALHEDPAHTATIADLERLATPLDRWSDLSGVFEDESHTTNDESVARDLAVRAASIAEDRLRDDVRATASYRHALSHGDDDAILAALDRIYVRGGNWREVAEVLERRVAIANEPGLLDQLDVRIAELREKRFEDPAGALSAYRNVIERNTSHPEALAGLERLIQVASVRADAMDLLEQTFTSIQDSHKLAWLIDLRVKGADLASDKVRLLGDLARIREERLNDAAGAFSALIEALGLDPHDEQVLSEIERLAPLASAWGRLRGVVEAAIESHRDDLDATTVAQLNLRAARWYREQLGDDAAAEARLLAAVAADPENPDALAMLEAIHRAAGREKDLVGTLRRRAEIELDTSLKKQMLREAATVAEMRLNDVDTAAQVTASLLDTDDSDVPALETLSRLRQTQGRHEDVAELLTRRARLADDPTQAVRLRRQVAELYAGPINDIDKAVGAYRDLLDYDAGDQSARAAIEDIFERTARWRDLEEALRARVDSGTSSEDRNATRLRLAKLAETRFQSTADAIDYLRQALDETPTHVEAGTGLERLYTEGRKWSDLSELLERRAQDYADAGDARGELSALVRIGELHERELNDVPRAVELYERVLERDANHVGALNALARLHEINKAWDRAAEMLSRAVDLAQPGRESGDIALRLALLRAEKLSDDEGAETALRRALDLDPTSQQAIDRLKALAQKRNDPTMLADVLEREVATVPEEARRVAIYKTLADLARDRLQDPARAAGYLEKARDLQPDNRDLLLPLVDMYLAAGRQADALPVIEKIIASYGTKRSKDLAMWHHRLGQAQRALGDSAGALASFDSAFKIDLTNVPILRDLGLLAYESGDLDRAQKMFRALLLQRMDANSGITKADVYFYLGDTLRMQNDVAKSIGMLERAVEADKTHPLATRLLPTLKQNGVVPSGPFRG